MNAVPIKIIGKYLTVDEAAKALGLAVDSVRRYCNADTPKLRGEKMGRDWLIPESEIKRYLKERKPAGRPVDSQ